MRFQPGHSGNPSGRPKGSRHKVSEAFVAAVSEDFDKHGVEVIERAREADPVAYLRILASLLPREIEVEPDRFGHLSDEDLNRMVRALAVQVVADEEVEAEQSGQVVSIKSRAA